MDDFFRAFLGINTPNANSRENDFFFGSDNIRSEFDEMFNNFNEMFQGFDEIFSRNFENRIPQFHFKDFGQIDSVPPENPRDQMLKPNDRKAEIIHPTDQFWFKHHQHIPSNEKVDRDLDNQVNKSDHLADIWSQAQNERRESEKKESSLAPFGKPKNFSYSFSSKKTFIGPNNTIEEESVQRDANGEKRIVRKHTPTGIHETETYTANDGSVTVIENSKGDGDINSNVARKDLIVDPKLETNTEKITSLIKDSISDSNDNTSQKSYFKFFPYLRSLFGK